MKSELWEIWKGMWRKSPRGLTCDQLSVQKLILLPFPIFHLVLFKMLRPDTILSWRENMIYGVCVFPQTTPVLRKMAHWSHELSISQHNLRLDASLSWVKDLKPSPPEDIGLRVFWQNDGPNVYGDRVNKNGLKDTSNKLDSSCKIKNIGLSSSCLDFGFVYDRFRVNRYWFSFENGNA